MKKYGISFTSLDDYIWDVHQYLWRHGSTIDESNRIVYPLSWYINTGRASTEFLRALVKTKPFMVARRLSGDGSCQDALNRVHNLIGV